MSKLYNTKNNYLNIKYIELGNFSIPRSEAHQKKWGLIASQAGRTKHPDCASGCAWLGSFNREITHLYRLFLISSISSFSQLYFCLIKVPLMGTVHSSESTRTIRMVIFF